MAVNGKIKFHPLSPERWDELVSLFGPRGACAGCWCMFWRQKKTDFVRNSGEPNKRNLKKLVNKGAHTGVLAYLENTPIGWCAIAPRQDLVKLEQHRTLKRIDDQPVWSIVCLFVAKPFRMQGTSVALIKAAADWARTQGANVIEGYPTEPGKKLPDPFVYTGLASAFRKAGFEEVARPARTRPIFRKSF